jgi:hypothetical protein
MALPVLLRRRLGARLLACACLGASAVGGIACLAPDQPPTADQGAAEVGLLPGSTFTYAAGQGLTETHELQESDVLFVGGFAVDLFARQNGFPAEARTLTFGIDATQISIVRLNSCLTQCGQPDQPLPWLRWPLTEGDAVDGQATVTEQRDGATTIRTEAHRTVVGATTTLTVPAGTFDVFPVSWTRTVTPEGGAPTVENAVLHIAPGTGVVKHEAFDGTALELQTAVIP